MKQVWESPVYRVQAVPVEKIVANDYNPNRVAPPEMRLLELSIWEDGYTQPIVCYRMPEEDRYVIVDGFHRYTVMLTSRRIRERERGLLPVVVIDKPLGERMASTIRHNRARGSHNIDLMAGIVAELVSIGKSDAWIARNIGMEVDEILRLPGPPGDRRRDSRLLLVRGDAVFQEGAREKGARRLPEREKRRAQVLVIPVPRQGITPPPGR